ncbi:MAG TPA: hypothetical protein VED59_03110 [Acidimicrobiales bacterium]|nr:hypothetical protein [Acidimicrobiales bacterium]
MIFVAPLGVNEALLKPLTRHFRRHGFEPVVADFHWRDTRETLRQKLDRLGALVDRGQASGKGVSLIGCSGGGSVALNVFAEHTAKISKVVNLCGRLKVGDHHDLDESAKGQMALYVESIKAWEARSSQLDPSARARILTLRPGHGDEFVPADTVTVDGAFNQALPTFEHILSIILGLTLLSGRVVRFLRS